MRLERFHKIEVGLVSTENLPVLLLFSKNQPPLRVSLIKSSCSVRPLILVVC
jgi:hypothetical protein